MLRLKYCLQSLFVGSLQLSYTLEMISFIITCTSIFFLRHVILSVLIWMKFLWHLLSVSSGNNFCLEMWVRLWIIFSKKTETFHYIYLLINSSNWRCVQLGIGSLKDCWEVWTESWLQKVLRLGKKMPSSCNIQYIPLHVSSMEEELEKTLG